jgi:coproporphyrinogen III oxidase
MFQYVQKEEDKMGRHGMIFDSNETKEVNPEDEFLSSVGAFELEFNETILMKYHSDFVAQHKTCHTIQIGAYVLASPVHILMRQYMARFNANDQSKRH